ncbi:unnamed protein product [Linum trigynum]|uniref:Uncharacterized protein n=1 Tax=Linum trigynum TaxID=586398 RepID=A0AAV2FP88_9ROSI
MLSISLEALAMAGVDYVEWGMDAEEWERQQLRQPPPPHLLADDHDLQEDHSPAATVVENDAGHNGNDGGDGRPSTDTGGGELGFGHKIQYCCLRFMITVMIVARGP